MISVNKYTLGKLSNLLVQNKYISDVESEILKEITQIYNWSKHSINMDSHKGSSFSVADSLVFYIIIRKLVASLLKPYYAEIVNELIRIDIKDRFLINLSKQDNLDYVK